MERYRKKTFTKMETVPWFGGRIKMKKTKNLDKDPLKLN